MSSTSIEKIRELERRRLNAAVDVDMDTLRSLLHPHLLYAHSNGARDSRETLLARIVSGYYSYKWITATDDEILIEGDLALITAVQDAEVLVGQNQLRLHNGTLSVWVNGGEEWQLIAFQPTVLST